ncbi:glutamyl-tRNA synthetase [Colletotrichum karsti]|uniref:Glutamate--tRNA ligase, mitochondrial n=1 Tax=Colletotrichum karsti TaxID=1095194 RepID=A0A9P6LJ21_9PEZI|nr:glutamyl-tRNA synthetase [Colletotrichum karsti]KAF9877904.1 glutamyl-tRNA synthetase [Colletotrichum karsti]
MTTISLRPHTRSLLQRQLYTCQKCRAGSPRWHSSTAEPRGFEALRKKLPTLGNKLRELPDKPARTRFAPSPTGYLHLGSLRTALYNWLLARATGGQFIIRVEDTDRTRIVQDAVPRLLSDLKWADLSWDEGPDVGGRFGPYVQSKRLHLYQKYLTQLLESGHAYRCFCTSHDLERHKQQSLDAGGTAHYPGTCRDVPVPEAERRGAAGEPHVVRFRAGAGRLRPSFVDAVYGNYQKNEPEDDFILFKSDGYPTYHFANVVDDHLMEITHVIRGAEWLISTPKHIALYEALGWEPPTFAHAGLLCAQNGEKLSKRNHDIDISSYRDKGILPSALNNWLALLGWSMHEKDVKKHGEVFYTTKDLAEKFSLRFTKGNIKTNPEKLTLFQGKHLTKLLTIENPSAGEERLLRQSIIPPTRALLARISDLVSSGAEERLVSPTNSRYAISVPDFSRLDPALDPRDRAASENQIMRILRTTMAKNAPVDPQALVYEHPSLFFRPSAMAYARHTFTRSRASLQPAEAEDGTSRPLGELVRELKAAFEAVPESEWGAARLQEVINEFGARLDETALVRGREGVNKTTGGAKAAYELLRMVLTGDADRGSKPAKLQLAVLGKSETLARFEMCCA